MNLHDDSESQLLLFEVMTPLGFIVRTTQAHWQVIVTIKHPTMAGREADVVAALQQPEQIRRSMSDADVYLFYRLAYPGRWICAVAQRLNGDGFLITTYPTDAIKAGEALWLT